MAPKLRPDTPALPPPCPRPASAEITPDEFDHYIKEARQMRATAMADILGGLFAAVGRLFRRPQRPARKHEPIFVQLVRPHTVRPHTVRSRTA